VRALSPTPACARPSRCLCLWPTAGMFIGRSGWSELALGFVCVRERERLSECFVSGPVGESHTSFFLLRSMLKEAWAREEQSRVSGGVRRSFFRVARRRIRSNGKRTRGSQQISLLVFRSRTARNGLWIEFLSLVGFTFSSFCFLEAHFLGLNSNFG
jgi:hypothetical protein